MATGVRVDPYRSFRFRVEIDGIQTAAFQEASVPSSTTGAVTYREGTDPIHMRQLSTTNSFSNLSLKKGLTDSMELYEWRKQVEDTGASGARRNISLILIDENGDDKARWEIVEAWPTKIDSTGLSAGGTAIMIDSIDLLHEGVTRVA